MIDIDHGLQINASRDSSSLVDFTSISQPGELSIRFGTILVRLNQSRYLVDPASSHMLISKIKPCMSKYKSFIQVKLRMAH